MGGWVGRGGNYVEGLGWGVSFLLAAEEGCDGGGGEGGTIVVAVVGMER